MRCHALAIPLPAARRSRCRGAQPDRSRRPPASRRGHGPRTRDAAWPGPPPDQGRNVVRPAGARPEGPSQPGGLARSEARTRAGSRWTQIQGVSGKAAARIARRRTFQLVHLSTNRRSSPCRQRPSARTTSRTARPASASSTRAGASPRSALSGAGSATTTTPGRVPKASRPSVDPHRERWKIMPAGSSDGSRSSATSASRPVLTSGRAPGPDAQRATVWSKNGSAKRSARQIGPVDRRDGPGKVEPDRRPAREDGELHYRRESVVNPDQESAHDKRPDQLDLFLLSQSGQIANPKGLGASRDEHHRGFVVGPGADRQTRKLQRNTAVNSPHARIERLEIPHTVCPSIPALFVVGPIGGQRPRRTRRSANTSRPPAMALGSSTALTASRRRAARFACTSASSRCRGGS